LSSLLKIPVSILFSFFCLTAIAGDPFLNHAGAAEAGMGYACIAKTGFWSSFNNQSLLAYNSSYLAGVNYENRFGISELGSRSVAIILPAGKSSIGALYNHFGYSDFSRDMTAIASGLKISEKLAAGVQIDYFSQRTTGEYEPARALTFEAGLLFQAGENTRIGLHLFNPLPNSLRRSFLPSSVRIGAGTKMGEQVYAGIETELSNVSKLLLRTGFEYEAGKNLWLRGGYCTDNNSFAFGVGYRLKILTLDLGFVTHERLGVSSSCSIIFKIK
jgi:hypothetical protein